MVKYREETQTNTQKKINNRFTLSNDNIQSLLIVHLGASSFSGLLIIAIQFQQCKRIRTYLTCLPVSTKLATINQQ